MSEFSHYMGILRKRSAGERVRELYSRFIREAPAKSLRRVMDICEKYEAKFTFYFVGISAECNKDFIREIIDRGHEIACHGYHHSCFDLLIKDEIRDDIEKCLVLFEKHFAYNIKGFRAPYLRYSKDTAEVLSELGFVYSSSYMEDDDGSAYNSKLIECPISVDDWTILIKQNRGQKGIYEEISKRRDQHATFLLHPWRVGRRRYVCALERFLDENSGKIKFPNMRDFVDSNEGIALSGDVGEMSLFEVLTRSLRGKR
ncbi:MAG: polysaccharide deacetylase family protein [Candidatus Scalindua sp.]